MSTPSIVNITQMSCTSLTGRLGIVVRQKRMVLGMSQEGLADLAQLNRTYIGKIERGETSVSVEVLQKVANGLNTTLSRLIADCERAG